MRVIGRLFGSVIVLVVTLVIEILLAMLLYIYLAVAHVDFFGTLVRWSRYALNGIIDQMEALLPSLSNQAYATLVGELGPKSFLLLFIGLFASGLIRVVAWLVKGTMRSMRGGDEPAGERPLAS
ncbi:MAG: hypothetical protein AAFR04_08705 [Pseudomonadota bacterium]